MRPCGCKIDSLPAKGKTMQITDLRINNYVLYNKDIVRIKEISQDARGCYFLAFDDGRQAGIDAIMPLRITQEWLPKLGFREVYRSENRVRFEVPEKFLKYDIDLCLNKILEGLMVYGNYVKCTGVHQLQNLYHSLTGHEIRVPDKPAKNRFTA